MADHRPARLLRLSSINANVNLSRPPFFYTFTTSDRDLHQVRHVSLKSVEIPNTQYNINSRNNVFNWNDGAPQSVTIPVGQYTMTDLLTALNAVVTPITTGFVLSEVTLRRKILFTSLTNPVTIQSTVTDPTNTMAPLLGVTIDSPVLFTTFESTSIYDISGLTHIYIASQALSNTTSMITGASQKTNIFADVPISVPFGAIQTKDLGNEENLDVSDFHSLKNISTIDIELQSAPEVHAELNGVQWTIVLKVWS